jgi:hypothetical protein
MTTEAQGKKLDTGKELNALAETISELAALVGMRFVVNDNKIKEFASPQPQKPQVESQGAARRE